MLDESARSLRIVGASNGARPGKKQQRFGKLVKEVARLKDAVRAWAQARPEIDRGAAECMRLGAEHRAALADLVRVLDRGYAHRLLTQRERSYLRGMLCETAREVLQASGPDAPDDVKAIYNRHARSDFDAEAAHEEAAQARMMRSMLEDLGLDLGDADIRSVSELEEATRARMDELEREADERERAREERAARRKKSARQVAAEARRETERIQVSKALQEVYRKLAVALHPDREPDPEERARKTVLMQQINVAYSQKDLLQLLELQLRFEQIDEAQIGTLAEDRLDRYNRLLAEQVAQLKCELLDLEMPWRMQLDLPPNGRVTPEGSGAALEQDMRAMAGDIAATRRQVEELADTRALKAWLRSAMSAGRELRALDALFRR
jgi:acyl transferase domain-containing protein